MKNQILTTIVRTKEINLTVVVENFLNRSEMFRDNAGKAIVENADIVGTAAKKVTEDRIIMIVIAPDEITTQKNIEINTKNLGEGDLETDLVAATESTIVVITKSKFLNIWIALFLGDMTQVILKEIDVITKAVVGEVTREIENIPGGKENPMSILTSRKRLRLR